MATGGGDALLTLNRREAEVLYALEGSGMPTIAEFRAEVGLPDATLDWILFALEGRGLVRLRPRRSRSASEALIWSTSPTPLHPGAVVGQVRRRLVRDIAPVDTQTVCGDWTVTLFLPLNLVEAYFVESDGGDLSKVILALRELQNRGLVPEVSFAARWPRGSPAMKLALCVNAAEYRPRLRLIAD